MGALRKYSGWIALAAAALALLALAAGLGGITLQPGQPLRLMLPNLAPSGPLGGDWLDIRLIMVAFLWFILIVSVVGVIVSRSLRRHLLRSLPMYVVYGLLVYPLFSNLRSCVQDPAGQAGSPIAPALPEQPQQPIPPPAAPPEFIASPPQWLVLAVSLAVGALVVGAIWLVAARARRKKPDDTLAKLAREAHGALAGIEAGENLRNAVLRCYAEMSRVLGEQRGVQRDKTMTPREFEARVAAVGLRDEHIRRLTRLFESVRYGPREPGEREEREAVACLSAIVEAYGGGARHEDTKTRGREGELT